MYRKFSFMLYSLGCFAAIGVCVIVNLAVSGALTWAVYPILSVPLGWAVGAPLWLRNTNRGVLLSLAAATVLAPPYLYLLAGQTGGGWFWPLGLPCAAVGIVAAWLVFALFRFVKISVLYKAALCVLLLGAVASPIVNRLADNYAGLPADGLNTFINVFASVLAAAVLAIVGFMQGAKARRGR